MAESGGFNRILTLLRKERGITQKEAAASLGVSQALLSHYEKGIRECGLDFVVRAADYYGVSCDYLLGRTADKSGAIIAVDEIPNAEALDTDNKARGSILPVLNKKLLFNSMNIIFNLLQRCDNKGLTNAVSSYLILAVYASFRQLYAANPKNPEAMFSVPSYAFQADVLGTSAKYLAEAGQLAGGGKVGDEEGLESEKAPFILPDNLAREFPLFASSLLNLLRKAEEML